MSDAAVIELHSHVIRAWRDYTGDLASPVQCTTPLRSIVPNRQDCHLTLRHTSEEIMRRLGLTGHQVTKVGDAVAQLIDSDAPQLTAETITKAVATNPLIVALYGLNGAEAAMRQIEADQNLMVEYRHLAQCNGRFIGRLPPLSADA